MPSRSSGSPLFRWTPSETGSRYQWAFAVENPAPDLTGAQGLNFTPDFVARLKWQPDRNENWWSTRELALADIAHYIDSFYNQRAATAISAASVRSNSKPLIGRFESVSN